MKDCKLNIDPNLVSDCVCWRQNMDVVLIIFLPSPVDPDESVGVSEHVLALACARVGNDVVRKWGRRRGRLHW